MIESGEAFRGGGEVHGEDHLWIVINDPQEHDQTALIVNVSTLRQNSDNTCILHRGDHPFIKHDSYVRFRSARAASTDDLEILVKARKLRVHERADPKLIERIRAAAMVAVQLPAELRALL